MNYLIKAHKIPIKNLAGANAFNKLSDKNDIKFRKTKTTFTNSDDQLKQNLCDIDELRTDAATPSPIYVWYR